MTEIISQEKTSTGIAGLDLILKGGLPVSRLYLLEGGKTTLGLQFLLEGALGTVMSLAPEKEKSLQFLLSSVLNDPKRRRFGESLRPIWNAITVTTHSEGKANESLPTADYQREDALLTLHLTAARLLISRVFIDNRWR